MNLPTISKERLVELYYEFIATARAVNEQKRRRRLGSYFDFFEKLPQAKKRAPGPQYVGATLVRVHRDVRPAILIHPNAEVGYRLAVRPNSKLSFAITTSPDDWERHGSGVRFQVEARWGLWNKKELFAREIDPRARKEHRAWFDCQVDLSEFAGQTIELIFRTRITAERHDYCSSYFGNPIVVEAA